MVTRGDNEDNEGGEGGVDEIGTPDEKRNARYGLVLFAIYCAFYGSFMAINVMSPATMARPVAAGINLAIVYGFALIVAALLLALVYMVLCSRNESAGR